MTKNNNCLRVLLVDDNQETTDIILQKAVALDIHTETSLVSALLRANEEDFDGVLLNPSIENCVGLDALDLISQQTTAPIVIVGPPEVSALGENAVLHGAQAWLSTEDLSASSLSGTITHAMARHKLRRMVRENLRELEILKSRFKSLIADNSDSLMIIDRSGIVKFINPAAEILFGRPASDLVHEPFGIPLEADEDREIDIVHRDGQKRYVEMRVTDTVWDGEKAYIATLRDISERKHAELELMEAQQKAKDSAEVKSQFLANISHELRSPLNAIIGYAELIESRAFGPVGDHRYLEYFSLIRQSGSELLSLINDLLDLAKIESGNLELSEDCCNLSEVLNDIGQFSADHPLGHRLRIAPNGPESGLACDRSRLTQGLWNVMQVALGHAQENTVVTLQAKITTAGEVEFLISEFENGFPREPFEDKFGIENGEDFCPSEGDSQFGVRLALAQTIVGLHHGRFNLIGDEQIVRAISILMPAKRLIPESVHPINLATG